MGLLKKIFSGKNKAPKGYTALEVKAITPLTKDSVKITFDVPDSLRTQYIYQPGQYLNLSMDINGHHHRRSYSICSGPREGFSIGVKKVEKGIVSNYLNDELQVGEKLFVSRPTGNFTLPREAKNVAAFAAGSGITPVLSMAKHHQDGNFRLYYGCRSEEDILFRSEIDALNASTMYFLSQEEKEDFGKGRLDADGVTAVIKDDLSILRSDAFVICGPEQMILDISETLKSFGVPENKIFFELFTTPVLMKQEDKESEEHYMGDSQITVILDGDKETFQGDDKTIILDAAINEGVDAPYSCKGGVCSTCKAKVLEGKAHMKMNYSLTDKEVEEGYILSCQASPRSEKIVVTYDV